MQERKRYRDLDIEIGFMEGLLESDPQYVDALEIIAQDYTDRGFYDKGLKADKRLTELKPSDPLAYYNLGCSYSLTGEAEKAADSLEVAISLGYKDFDYLDIDPDLSNLRSHPAYQKILYLRESTQKRRRKK